MSLRAVAIVAASVIAALMVIPTVASAQSPTTTSTIPTTIVEPEPEIEPGGFDLPDAEAADADAVAAEPTFTG